MGQLTDSDYQPNWPGPTEIVFPSAQPGWPSSYPSDSSISLDPNVPPFGYINAAPPSGWYPEGMKESDYASMVKMLADHDIANVGWVQVGEDGQRWIWTGSRPDWPALSPDFQVPSLPDFPDLPDLPNYWDLRDLGILPDLESPATESTAWATAEWGVITYDWESMRKMGASNIQSIGSNRLYGTLGVKYVPLDAESPDEPSSEITDPHNGEAQSDPLGDLLTFLAALGLVVSGALAALIAMFLAALARLGAAAETVAAWLGLGLCNLGQRFRSLWQSVLRFFGRQAPAVEGEGAAVGEDAAALANKLHHIFDDPKHALDGLVQQFGSQKAAFDAVQLAANQALKAGKLIPNANGILPKGDAGYIIDVAGTPVRLIGGLVQNGVVRISSFSRYGL